MPPEPLEVIMLHLVAVWILLLFYNTAVMPSSVVLALGIIYGVWFLAGLGVFIAQCASGSVNKSISTPSVRAWFGLASYILTLVYALSVGWYVPVLLIIFIAVQIFIAAIAVIASTIAECQQ